MSRRTSAKRPRNNRIYQGRARQRWQVAIGLAGASAVLSAVIAVNTQQPFVSRALAQTGTTPGDAVVGHDGGLHVGHNSLDAPEPLYDGTVRPQDIPDSVAISVLMNSLRVPNYSDATALRQFEAKVRRMDLGEDDSSILLSEIVAFDADAKVQEALLEAIRPAPAPGAIAATARFPDDRYMDERRNLATLAEDRFAQLLDSLSPAGAARLEEHLLHVKTRIKVFPPPNMPKSTL